MQNLSERIVSDILHHLSLLTVTERSCVTPKEDPHMYYALRSQLRNIVAARLYDSLLKEFYSEGYECQH